MSTVPAYAKFLSMLSTMRQQCGDAEFEGCDEVLSFIAVKETVKRATKFTDLVQSMQFGTGPTVQRKVSMLAKRGLIDVQKDEHDARVKTLRMTAAGLDLLKERTTLLKHCMEN